MYKTHTSMKVLAVGPLWEATQLNEQSNAYIEELCTTLSFFWHYLARSGNLPVAVRKKAWEDIVGAGYCALLDGFARVQSCSTEGRSLMSMDLASFSNGTTPEAIMARISDPGIEKPPEVLLAKGREYVDTFVKASYLPPEDLLNWIEENHQRYHLHHCLALVQTAVDSRQASHFVRQVQGLYDRQIHNNENGGHPLEVS